VSGHAGRRNARRPQQRPQEPQEPEVFVEVIITFKLSPDDGNQRVEVFRQSFYQIAGPVLVVKERKTGDMHLFHWDDVDNVKAVATQLEVAN
jgi:hypothetical protein